MGIDRTQFSQEIQAQIVYAGSNSTSYPQSQKHLKRLAHLDLEPPEVRRVCQRIGEERIVERDADAEAYQALPLMDRKKAPEGVEAPDLGVVSVDGGRLQIWERSGDAVEADEDANASTDHSERGQHWREDKIGVLMTMKSDEHESDPCPEIPATFVDPTKIAKLAREFNKPVPSGSEAAKSEEEEAASDDAKSQRKPPEVVQKTMVASRRKWLAFGPMVACAAWKLGFYGAKRKAFIADGSENNWTMWANHFSSFVPILDFIHALTYVFGAAMAGRDFATGWVEYERWITWVWQGKVGLAIAEMEAKLATLGEPLTSDGPTHPREVLRRAIGYLSNNESRMKYAEYRTAGLPMNSSVVESTVKQFNYRVKGSEKFWNEAGAEAMLQLRADELSDTQPLEEFWRRREDAETGQNRNKRSQAKGEAVHAQAA